jgi:hypothetical protein
MLAFTVLAVVPPGKFHWIGGWVGHGTGLDAMARIESPCPCQESNGGRPARSLVTTLPKLPRLLIEIGRVVLALLHKYERTDGHETNRWVSIYV